MFILFNITFTYIDVFFFIVILILGIVGYYNGLINELLKLFLWIISIMLSLIFYKESSNFFSQFTDFDIIIKITSFLIPVVLSYFFLSLFIRNYLFNFNELSGITGNKFFGFIFGVFKGFFIIIISFGGLIYLFNTKENFPEIISNSLLLNPTKSFSIYIMEFFFSMF